MSDLDAKFGVVRVAQGQATGGLPRTDWERERTPLSLCFLDAEAGRSFAALGDAARHSVSSSFVQSARFIWAVVADGRLVVAVEEVAQINGKSVTKGLPTRRQVEKAISLDSKLGHPCLTGDNYARIAGEFYLDISRDSIKTGGRLVWTINDQSGRFHGTPDRWASREQLRNVARLFADNVNRPILIEGEDDLVPVEAR